MPPNDQTLEDFRIATENVVSCALKAGVVITVETIPLKPLAMGHYELKVTTRAAIQRP
jgi:hypothetical protein